MNDQNPTPEQAVQNMIAVFTNDNLRFLNYREMKVVESSLEVLKQLVDQSKKDMN